MKIILDGDGEAEPLPDQVAQLAQEVYNNDILQLLVLNIWRFEFEVSSISSSRLRFGTSLSNFGYYSSVLIISLRTLIILSYTGKERRFTNLQQSITSTNWFSLAYRRVLEYETGRHL